MPTMTTPTVTVTCACGASFSREVKRGRPQIWCPKCLTVPFYERVGATEPRAPKPAPKAVVATLKPARPAATTTEVTDATTAPSPGTTYDDYADSRDQIEAEVAAVYADHTVRYQARLTAGEAVLDAAHETSAETRTALQAIYAKYPKRSGKSS